MQQVELVDIYTQLFAAEQEKQAAIGKQAFQQMMDPNMTGYCHMDQTSVAPQHMEHKDIAHTDFHMMGIQQILDKMDGNWMDQPNIELMMSIKDQVVQYS